MNKKKIDLSNMSALIVLIALCVVLSIAEPTFRGFNNIINILQQVTVIAVLALGVNVVIFTGGIDISVGSIVAFTGIVMGKIIVEAGMPSPVGIAVALLIGAACGTFNGLMMIPNLIGVLVLSPLVFKCTKNYSDRYFRHKDIEPMLSVYPEIQNEYAEAVKNGAE